MARGTDTFIREMLESAWPLRFEEMEEIVEEGKNILKVLAMTRRPRACQTDLSGEVPAAAVDAAMAVSPGGDQKPRPAAALVAALQAVPETDIPEMEGSKDESIKVNLSLVQQTLVAGLDERIAALTRVLEAPDDNPTEMAAARAALARSKAYPKLEEWRPFEEVSTRETYRSVLGGGVLPSEEACVLSLYRDLLSEGEPGEAEDNASTGEDTVDKEELRYELVLQNMHRRWLTGSDAHHLNFAFKATSEAKARFYTSVNAARTTGQRIAVERIRMDCDESLAELSAHTDDQDQREYRLPKDTAARLCRIFRGLDISLHAYASPFNTKAEKLVALLELMRSRVEANEANNIIKVQPDCIREILAGLMMPDLGGLYISRPVEKQNITVSSPDDSTKDIQYQNTGEELEKSSTSASEIDGIRRAMDPPLSLAEMASAVGRVLRWREQLLSKSLSKHRAHDYNQRFKDVLHDFEFNLQCEHEPSSNNKECLPSCGKEDGVANGSKLVIQDIFVSGSVSEATEMHIAKEDAEETAHTFRAFEWESENGFAMPHWIEKGYEWMATWESSDDEASDVTFENASDIDFMLDAGPVNWEKPVREDSETEQSHSSARKVRQLNNRIKDANKPLCSVTARNDAFTVEEATNTKQDISSPPRSQEPQDTSTRHKNTNTQASCSRAQREGGSTCSESPDNILTLHAEKDYDCPGMVEVHRILRRKDDTFVGRKFELKYFFLGVAAAMDGVVDLLWEDFEGRIGPNIEATLNGDKIDLVPCLQYPERVSDEFVNRERPSGQPSKDLVKKLSVMPIYLVRIGDKFRISFSRPESEVIRSMTKPQRICLVLLKHCAAVTVRGSGALHSGEYLCSYDLKTAMMWVCERRAPELWTWDGMLDSMMAVLDFLIECAERGALPSYFDPEINLWRRKEMFDKGFAVLRLRVLLPRAIQLLLAGLLSSSQAPLMRHLLNLPLDAQQMLWCCWKRRVDDPYPTGRGKLGKIDPRDLCCRLYPAAVDGWLWSERFLDTFRWESLPARCREPDWFAEHGWDTDSEGEEEEEDREDKDGEGEEENEKDTDGESEGENSEETVRAGEEEGVVGAMKTGNGSGNATGTAGEEEEEARKRDPDIDEESTTTSKKSENNQCSLTDISEH